MKKILFGFIALLSFNAATMAQAAKKAVAKPAETKMAVVPAKAAASTKVVVAKPAVGAKVVAITKPEVAKPGAVVLKKDGTPDKRFKDAKATGPVKKDGTPDKRYIVNKKTH